MFFGIPYDERWMNTRPTAIIPYADDVDEVPACMQRYLKACEDDGLSLGIIFAEYYDRFITDGCDGELHLLLTKEQDEEYQRYEREGTSFVGGVDAATFEDDYYRDNLAHYLMCLRRDLTYLYGLPGLDLMEHTGKPGFYYLHLDIIGCCRGMGREMEEIARNEKRILTGWQPPEWSPNFDPAKEIGEHWHRGLKLEERLREHLAKL